MTDNKFRYYFPIFKKKPEIVYFDSAATSLKTQSVIDAFFEFYNNNGLSLTSLSFLSTENIRLIKETRQKTANFINASPEEIIFTKGTTETLNFVSQMLSEELQKNDEIITSELEHNSAIAPWIRITKKKSAKLVFIPLSAQNKITLENFRKILNKKTKIIALTHMSNAIGYKTPIQEIVQITRQFNKKIVIILDAAQSISTTPIDIKKLDIDFLAFSAHKIYGPFGLGIMFGKKYWLNKLQSPTVGGGNIQKLYENKFESKPTPNKYEPGTPNISSIIAFRHSLIFIEKIGLETARQHIKKITIQIVKKLKKIKKIHIFNPDTENIILFNIDKVHAHDVETFLSLDNIYIRTGTHCADLLAHKINQISTIRVSIGIHNNKNDIKILINSLKKIIKIFQII